MVSCTIAADAIGLPSLFEALANASARRLVAPITPARGRQRYDPLGRLYEVDGSDTGITRFLYDGNDLVAEYNSSGTLLRRYMFGPGADQPILWDEGSAMDCSGTHVYQADERGSIIASANCSGNLTHVYRYDEYGIPQSWDGSALIAANGARFGYTGQVWLPELGLYYYKARMYSPTLGRFMQTDPIGYGDGMNMYRYVGNDPVNGTDPTGLIQIGGLGGGSGAIGGSVGSNESGWSQCSNNPGLVAACPPEGNPGITVTGPRTPQPLIENMSLDQCFQTGICSSSYGPTRQVTGGQVSGSRDAPQKTKDTTCDKVARQTGPVAVTRSSGAFVPGLGVSGGYGGFRNLRTGSTGWFYTVGGNLGFDAGAGVQGGIYKSVADFRGVNFNVNWSVAVSGSLNFSAGEQLVGGSLGTKAELGASVSVTNTVIFHCVLKGS
jgi:RHS repeat-associated protein